MQWKRFKPYRRLAFWTTAVLYGLCMINVPPAQTCQLPDERNDTGRFVAQHLDKTALMASKTVFSLSLYPKCFAPVSVSNGTDGWAAEALRPLQQHAYRSYKNWMSVIAWAVWINAVWFWLFAAAAAWKGIKKWESAKVSRQQS
ncbi:hypothetical protein [Neisseria sp. S1]|uniref:hypothetical protein n=1 Tax=Neisseria sp. S1 TaxID=3318354 RepID=UPI003A8BDFD6